MHENNEVNRYKHVLNLKYHAHAKISHLVEIVYA
jgi:hypothetical protein